MRLPAVIAFDRRPRTCDSFWTTGKRLHQCCIYTGNEQSIFEMFRIVRGVRSVQPDIAIDDNCGICQNF